MSNWLSDLPSGSHLCFEGIHVIKRSTDSKEKNSQCSFFFLSNLSLELTLGFCRFLRSYRNGSLWKEDLHLFSVEPFCGLVIVQGKEDFSWESTMDSPLCMHAPFLACERCFIVKFFPQTYKSRRGHNLIIIYMSSLRS